MDREFHEEWRRLEEQAIATLERRPIRAWLQPECQALVRPSFEDCSAYTLMVPGEGHKASICGVKRVWRRTIDASKFESPVIRLKHPRNLEPTIQEQDVPLPPQRVNEILVRAAALAVPARSPEKVLGLDGVMRVLSFGEHFHASRFQWYGHPPSGWQDLLEILQETVEIVERALTDRSTGHRPRPTR